MNVDNAGVHQGLLDEYVLRIDAAQDADQLLETTLDCVAAFLKRKDDASHRAKTQAAVGRYFASVTRAAGTPAGEKLNNLKAFAKEIARIIVAERGLIPRSAPPAGAGPAQPTRRAADGWTEPLARQPVRMIALEGLAESGPAVPAAPTAITVVAPHPPQHFGDFGQLFPAALWARVERTAAFFHRHNPQVVRPLPRPFLLSPAFAGRLAQVVTTDVAPRMMSASRSVSLLATSRKWAGVDTVQFWEVVDADQRMKTAITAAWASVWDGYRQRRGMRVGADGKTVTVLTASTLLLDLRRKLAPAAGEYQLPPVRNREVDLLTGLLFGFDLDRMEYTWTRLRQIYEQELDRRVYQDKARPGAFRDSMLDAFELVPDLAGDFLAMLCYFCFPNCDLAFLDRFTHNKGSTAEERQARIPYLMEFLAAEGVDAARRQEAARKAEAVAPVSRPYG